MTHSCDDCKWATREYQEDIGFFCDCEYMGDKDTYDEYSDHCEAFEERTEEREFEYSEDDIEFYLNIGKKEGKE